MLDRVKVLFLVTKGDVGGAQKYVTELAAGLDRKKFELVVAAGEEGEEMPADYKVKWLTNKWQPFFLFYKDVLAIWELRRLFRKVRPAVVHLNSSKAGVVGALAAKIAGVPKVVFTAHGWVFADERLSYPRRLFYRWLHKIAARWQDRIITVSEYDRRLALKHKIAPEGKLIKVWNGIDVKKFRDNLFSREEAREEIFSRVKSEKLPFDFAQGMKLKDQGIRVKSGGEEVWVGSVGRLVKEKNYGLLIEAASQLKVESRPFDFAQGIKSKGREIRFFIIGEGEEKKNLELRIANYGLEKYVFIAPPKGDDAKLMRAFDVFVLPSRKEGLPYTIIEAMTAGVPVVVSQTGGMTELAEGERGWIFESGDENDLAEKIGQVLSDKEERERRVEAARKFAEKELTVERMVREIEKIYLS